MTEIHSEYPYLQYFIERDIVQGLGWDAESIQECVEHIRATWPEKRYNYEGYMLIQCDSVELFVWQCLTHFLSEGLSDDLRIEQCDIYRQIFIDLGYATADTFDNE